LYNVLRKYKTVLVYLPLAVYWLILFILTSLPSKNLPNTKINDKIEHSVAFCLLAVFLSLTFQFQQKIKFLSAKALTSTVFLIAVYGMLDELHQRYVPGRYCDFYDWVADVAGGLAGVLFVYFLKKITAKEVRV